MKKYMITFFTHSGAILFDRMCKKENINCELMPVPRKLSSNCGIGAEVITDISINNLIDEEDEEIEKIFLIDKLESKLIYESEN